MMMQVTIIIHNRNDIARSYDQGARVELAISLRNSNTGACRAWVRENRYYCK